MTDPLNADGLNAADAFDTVLALAREISRLDEAEFDRSLCLPPGRSDRGTAGTMLSSGVAGWPGPARC